MAPFNLYNSNMFDCYSHHAHLLIGAIFSKSMLSNLAKVKMAPKKLLMIFLKCCFIDVFVA